MILKCIVNQLRFRCRLYNNDSVRPRIGPSLGNNHVENAFLQMYVSLFASDLYFLRMFRWLLGLVWNNQNIIFEITAIIKKNKSPSNFADRKFKSKRLFCFCLSIHRLNGECWSGVWQKNIKNSTVKRETKESRRWNSN